MLTGGTHDRMITEIIRTAKSPTRAALRQGFMERFLTNGLYEFATDPHKLTRTF